VILQHGLKREPGWLEVRVLARDEVGLLLALLRIFGFYALFPVELSLRAEGGRAEDTFRLQTMGGQPPSPEAAAAVDGRLGALHAGGPAAGPG
jgi:hypothetical protein